MQIHRTITSLHNHYPLKGRTAFVPTMGNLHEGHLSLIKKAHENADHVIVSIFVNRLQFGPSEDFDQYPRTFEADCEKLRASGVHHLFVPDENVIYPQPQQYLLTPAPAHSNLLEGAFRPDHFTGVATVVLKLFNIVQPDIALFGKKDYQQLMILSNMVRELALPITIIPGDIIRAEDGLALSSRNSYLSAAQRQEAPRLYRLLTHIVAQVRSGHTDFNTLETVAQQELAAYGWQPDYLTIRRRKDLQLPVSADDALVILSAARLGSTRLLDNLEI